MKELKMLLERLKTLKGGNDRPLTFSDVIFSIDDIINELATEEHNNDMREQLLHEEQENSLNPNQ